MQDQNTVVGEHCPDIMMLLHDDATRLMMMTMTMMMVVKIMMMLMTMILEMMNASDYHVS